MSNSCVMCRYSITDPVCGRCYIKQTEAMLNDLKVHSLAIEVIMTKIKSKFIETLNDTVCILCKKENVALCRYCFSLILINTLRELNLSEKLIKNFEYLVDEENYLVQEVWLYTTLDYILH